MKALLRRAVKNPELAPLWFRLRQMIAVFEDRCRLMKDEPGYYRLYHDSRRPFAAVVVQSRHVGLYLMAVHVSEDLFNSLSPELRRLLSGKSFAFRDEEDPALQQVPALLAACFALGEH